jgi:hypothetical protein
MVEIHQGNWAITASKINERFSKDGRTFAALELKAEYDKLRK